MDTKKVFLFVMTGLFLVGCGRNYSGVYRGSESITENGTPKTQDVTITLNQDNNDNITGTYVSASGSGNLTGKATGQGITNVSLTMTPIGQNNYGVMPGMYGVGSCSMTYTGTFNTTQANKINGTLINSSAGSMTNCMYSNTGTLIQSRTIDAGK